jgi:ribose/xylose/arabinose/galactoside ABC-type transport system permease subunit
MNTRRYEWLRAGVRRQPLLPVLVVLLVALAAYNGFATAANFRNIAVQASPLVIAAVGMTYVIMTAGIDLSVGAMLFLAAAVESSDALIGRPAVLVIVAVAAAGLILGLINGVAVAMTSVPALIVTLATMQVFRGAGGHITQQQDIILPSNLRGIGTGSLLGVPNPVIIAVVVASGAGLAFTRTVFGRYVQAVGSNRTAAVEAGLPVRWVLVGVYTLAGLLAGVASLTQTARLGAVQPSIGDGYELTVITAVVLGGTSLFGGVGSVIGTVIGVFIPAVLNKGFTIIGVNVFWQPIAVAIVLVAAVWFDQVRRRARNQR